MYGRVSDYFESAVRRVSGDLSGDDFVRVMWLSSTLFFVVGGYWLLRSLKDPIMSVIDGVSALPRSLHRMKDYLRHDIFHDCNRLNIFRKRKLHRFSSYLVSLSSVSIEEASFICHFRLHIHRCFLSYPPTIRTVTCRFSLPGVQTTSCLTCTPSISSSI
jgi:hypothetical protein